MVHFNLFDYCPLYINRKRVPLHNFYTTLNSSEISLAEFKIERTAIFIQHKKSFFLNTYCSI